MSYKIFTVVDGKTNEPVNRKVYYKKEKDNPDKKIYKILGYVKVKQKIKEREVLKSKLVLSEINGDSRILVSYKKLINCFYEIKNYA